MKKKKRRRFLVLDVETRYGNISRRAYEMDDDDIYVKSKPPKTLICTFIGIAFSDSAAKAIKACEERTDRCH